MLRNSRAIIFRFNSKTQWQMFLSLYGRHVCIPLGRATKWRLHTKLYKFGWNTFPNNARMKSHIELQSWTKWIKKIRPPFPHFNDRKNGALWLGREFIRGGGVVLFCSWQVCLSINHLSYLRFYSWLNLLNGYDF